MAYNDGASKENLHFADQSKQAFFFRLLSQTTTRVSITRWKHGKCFLLKHGWELRFREVNSGHRAKKESQIQ